MIGKHFCRFCEYLGGQYCPFDGVLKKNLDDAACAQFMPLRNVAQFKDRMAKKTWPGQPRKRNDKSDSVLVPDKRSLEF